MHPATLLPDAPPPELRFKRRVSIIGAGREMWAQRETVRSLVERELRARYKQTVLSWSWALISPLALMLVFTIIIDRVANVDTEGAPYALFAYLGLLAWTFFTASLNQASNCLIVNKALLNKLYCPREMFPVSSVAIAVVDSLIASTALVLLFVSTGYAPRATSVWVLPLLVPLLFFSVGIALVISVTVVYLRDVRNALGLILQLGLFATPIAYRLDAIPARALPYYCFANPIAPVIDGFRRAVLYGQQPQWGLVGLGTASSVLVLLAGYWYFKRAEAGIADVA